LVVGAESLGDGQEGEGNGEQGPETAGRTGTAAGDIQGGESSKHDHGKLEGVCVEKASAGSANELRIDEEKQRREQGNGKGESRKLSGREQGGLTQERSPDHEKTGDGPSVQQLRWRK